MSDMADESQLMRIPEVAKVLAVSTSTCYRWAREGIPPFGKDGPIKVLLMGEEAIRCVKADVMAYTRSTASNQQ